MKKSSKYLLVVSVLSFVIRLIPHRTGSVASLDSYLHRDISLRILEQGFSFFPSDILSILGFRPYSYPLGFHTIMAGLFKYIPQRYVIWFFPALLGTISAILVYFVAQEVFEDKDISLVAALFFSMVPSFIFRSAVIIPENMGILFFLAVMLFSFRFVKTGSFNKKIIYSVIIAVIFFAYVLTHRGWFFLVITLSLLVFMYYIRDLIVDDPKYIIIFPVLAAPLIYEPFRDLVSQGLSRFPRSPVTALGFFKWSGVIQFSLGVYGAWIFLRQKGRIKRFLAVWGILFTVIGAYSFRFRDPYALIPLSILGAYVFVKEVIPRVRDLKEVDFRTRINLKKFLGPIIIILLFLTTVQGAYASYSYLNPPEVREAEAIDWIRTNTHRDSVFLTWREEGYRIIGETQRRDIITWNKVYQGFMGNTPSLQESNMAYSDVVDMFVSANEKKVYYLINKYNISYVYYDKRMWGLGLLAGGLSSYLPYDTHFDPQLANGYSKIDKYVNNPPKPEFKDEIDTNSTITKFLNKFWNGYSYSDYGENYKGNYVENARVGYLLNYLHNKTGKEEYKQRYEWILKWLNYKQLPQGGWSAGKPPDQYSLTTALVTSPLTEMKSENNHREESLKKSKEFLLNQIKENGNSIKTSPSDHEEEHMINSRAGRVINQFSNQSEPIIQKVVGSQNNNGGWEKTKKNIAILRGLTLYNLNKTEQNQEVDNAINRGAEWLKNRQKDNGKFTSDEDIQFGIEPYSSSLLIYHYTNSTKAENKTLNWIKENYEPMEEQNPLAEFMDLYMDLKYAYGNDKAYEIIAQILKK